MRADAPSLLTQTHTSQPAPPCCSAALFHCCNPRAMEEEQHMSLLYTANVALSLRKLPFLISNDKLHNPKQSCASVLQLSVQDPDLHAYLEVPMSNTSVAFTLQYVAPTDSFYSVFYYYICFLQLWAAAGSSLWPRPPHLDWPIRSHTCWQEDWTPGTLSAVTFPLLYLFKYFF